MLDHSSEAQRRRARSRWGNLTPAERFWAKVDKSGEHWIWKGATASGYGTFRYNGRMENAHRVALLLSGVEIPEGMDGLHKCDIKLCVRPSCLFVGTHMDNMQDMISKGRQALGARLNHGPQDGANNHAAKLTPEIVEQVRKLHSGGMSQRGIARELNLHYANVWCIFHRKSWN
jgi:hypothetical protein